MVGRAGDGREHPGDLVGLLLQERQIVAIDVHGDVGTRAGDELLGSQFGAGLIGGQLGDARVPLTMRSMPDRPSRSAQGILFFSQQRAESP